ncbi:carboxypeptidase-like regulatory domain-containing protein [Flammeovirga sp. OC4]|uniref:TonB-dependent receptor n=1 Tax=Flammeovirga sp. OC4 TaxID=1382345 RepID=UPI0009E54B59|nr:carboxypeptidase-like regulatory domain-containing protein [Flammeovirga sp. OC4]
MMKKTICSMLFLLLVTTAFTQELKQVIRGQIVDATSKTPLAFATIIVTSLETPLGTVADDQGNFRLEGIPVGRQNLKVTLVGYEPAIVNNLMLNSAKELVLTIPLKESATQMEEVVIRASEGNGKTLNEMVSVSGQSFTVEQTERLAVFDDPARVVASFAGVTTGNLDDNGVVIRGNAPKGVLWRLEGVEIPNPNHFGGLGSFGGGAISALSGLMLGDSDFLTGAFPAEYGNAMSGVFDMQFRNGNNETSEHAVQLGTLGLDISSEGPFSKNSNASYLFNYRYSTLALIKPILPEDNGIPTYQDLSFKINVPTQKAGVFSIWGLGLIDGIDSKANNDTTEWVSEYDSYSDLGTFRTGILGLTHNYSFSNKTFLKTSIVASHEYKRYEEERYDFLLDAFPTRDLSIKNNKWTASTVLQHKFNASHFNRTGVIVNQLHYNSKLAFSPEFKDPLQTYLDEQSTINTYQFFTQSQFDLTSRLKLNVGIHSQYVNFNEELTFEPRASLSCQISPNRSIGFAYGKHSKLEPLPLYFSKIEDNGVVTQPNTSLPLSKSHHYVFSYDWNINDKITLSIEPYYQRLYDVPVIPDSSYSAINIDAQWLYEDKMEGTGTGENMGIDITLSRSLNQGFYYMFTGSVFDSKYKGGDGIERNTRFNRGFVINAIYGKEWVVGKSKNKVLGLSGRLNLLGGKYTTPLDTEESMDQKEAIYDESKIYTEKQDPSYRLDISFYWKINKRRHTGTWKLQLLNALGSKDDYGYLYNYQTQNLEKADAQIVIPSLAYKIEF